MISNWARFPRDIAAKSELDSGRTRKRTSTRPNNNQNYVIICIAKGTNQSLSLEPKQVRDSAISDKLPSASKGNVFALRTSSIYIN